MKTTNDEQLARVLRDAANEITLLRQENRLLAAKVETMDLMRALVFGPPGPRGASPDVAAMLRKLAEESEARMKSAELKEQIPQEKPPGMVMLP